MPITHRGKGYPIPDEPEPEGYHCVRVYVPDDSLYIGIFWQSLHYLASPRAWANDSSHTALVAAEVWRAALQKSQEIDGCASGDCGIMDIRQPETTPCIIEKLDDCSGDWEQAADLRLCVPKMRIKNGILQQDTTGLGDWVDAGDPEQPYDPRFDKEFTPVWTTTPPGQQGDCLSAVNVSEYINLVVETFVDCMIAENTFFETLSGLMVIITAVMDILPLTWLTAAITEAYGVLIDSWQDVKDYNTRAQLAEFLRCRFFPDGSMTSEQWAILVQDITDFRAGLTDADERARWELILLLVNLWGPVGLSVCAGIWGLTSYDCSAFDECGAWQKVFTWDTSEEGWHNYYIPSQDPHYLGTFTPPAGWVQDKGHGGGAWVLSCEIEKHFTACYITDITSKVSAPILHDLQGIHWYWEDSGGALHDFGETSIQQGTNDYHLALDQLCYGLKVTLWAVDYSSNEPTNPFTLMDVTIEGTGANPFN